MAAPLRTVRGVGDPAALARAAAEEILQHARAALAARGAFHVALSGGSTPRAAYAELATRSSETDFTRWQVWFGDERCVPPDHADSNFRMARESFLAHVAVPFPRVHRLRGEDPDPARAAADYERDLLASLGPRPRLDLALLGLGSDGHTASLFPGTRALEERERWVVATQVSALRAKRLTLTRRTLDAARAVVFLVAGAEKAEALAAVLAGPSAERPASLIAPVDGTLLWLADRAALAGIEMESV